MLFQDEEEGEELKTRRSFILQQLVPVWQASERKSELLTAMSCQACLPGNERFTGSSHFTGKCVEKSPELKAQHDLLGNLGITLLMLVGSTSTEMNGSQLLQAAAQCQDIFQYADLIYLPG